MGPIVDVFERIKAGEPVRALNSSPPQHGKTEIELHAIAQVMLRRPWQRHAFVSHTARFAHMRSRDCLAYAKRAGVRLAEDVQSRREWRTAEGGGLLAMGIDGDLTGEKIDGVLVIDDPYRDRADAESVAHRAMVSQFYSSAAHARIHPTTSIVVTHTRWHPDDLYGELSRQKKLDEPDVPAWDRVNIPAVNEAGEALWEAGHPLSALREIRERNEYEWWALYMGEPRIRGKRVFEDVHFYDELPKTYRVGVGIDLAYTAKTHSDWCVAWVMAESEGKYYVLDLRRAQATVPVFCSELRQLKVAYPGARWLWYTSTTERGLADMLREESGVPIVGEIASVDKFFRAQPFAAAWNRGLVLLPRNAPWVPALVGELSIFTGVGDKNDDQVDAGAACFDVLDRGSGLASPGTVKSKFTNFGGNPFAPTGKVDWKW